MAKLLSQIGLTYDDVDTTVEFLPGLFLTCPMIATNMQSVISTQLCITLHNLGGIALLHQFQSIEKEVAMLKVVKQAGARVLATIGARGDFLERAKALIDNGVDGIEMDTPHGHSSNMLEGIKAFKKQFPNISLIAGTVATKEGAIDLIKAGVQSLKIGVGAGAACTTRINAGVGVPQFSAVLEVAEVVKDTGVTLIADAGIKNPGCFSKAIGAGGTVIMSGKIFAATTESNSEIIVRDGKEYKIYFGEASAMARTKRIENDPMYKANAEKYVEGAEGLILHSGSLESLITHFLGGLRSAMSYSGARTIDEFHEKATFMQVTTNGGLEATPHGLLMRI